MDSVPNDKLQIYLKLIDYKRSIGTTQWTILSLFSTASGAAFVYAFGQTGNVMRYPLPLFAVMIYWLGLLLYRRYRNYNREVSNFIRQLEEEVQCGFQKHLDQAFHDKKGMSTEAILILAGVIYSIFALVVLSTWLAGAC